MTRDCLSWSRSPYRAGGLRFVSLASCLIWFVAAAGWGADERLVVHEWGTFTNLQDDTGNEIYGINIDDEPVPPFVHQLHRSLLHPALVTSADWTYRQKGVPRHHPLVSMRLETPVVYFYPPPSAKLPLTLDVTVKFPSGWLSEFYPQATVDSPLPKSPDEPLTLEQLDSKSLGQLTWKGLQVGVDARGPNAGPETDWPVWLAPRQVPRAAQVRSAEGECEKYLFYRGVARLPAPLQVIHERTQKTVAVHRRWPDEIAAPATPPAVPLWLVHVRRDGQLAYRSLGKPEWKTPRGTPLVRASTQFEPHEYAVANVERLKGEMHAALVADGLYVDEATAMLATWRRAYFTSHGLRVFYIVPRPWTDARLPLTLSCAADLVRTMIGRVELISDEQQALLERLANTPVSPGDWIDKLPPSAARDRFMAGRSDHGDLGFPLPPDYQTYYDLGRFRNSLVAHAERTAPPTSQLEKFLNQYGLRPYRLAR